MVCLGITTREGGQRILLYDLHASFTYFSVGLENSKA